MSLGSDANRRVNAGSCGSASFSYNAGDQLATSPYGSGYVYDAYGNLDTYAKTGGGSVNFDYDSFDHTIRIDDSTTRVDSVLSPDGRVLRRTVSSPPGVTITEDRWYGYTDSSDSPAWSRATSGGAYTTFLSNLVVTGTTPSYQISDPKGTVVGTVTQAGAFTTNSYPDEYGNVATVPTSRLNWLGTQKRFVDHPGLNITRMGVRAYDPHLGRFLSQDPIVGGSANDYDYVNADPINNLDLAGTHCTGRHCVHAPRIDARRWISDRARSVGLAVSWARKCFDCVLTSVQIGEVYYIGIVGGALIAGVGVTICTTVAGCLAGGPLIAAGGVIIYGSARGLKSSWRNGVFDPNRYRHG